MYITLNLYCCNKFNHKKLLPYYYQNDKSDEEEVKKSSVETAKTNVDDGKITM